MATLDRRFGPPERAAGSIGSVGGIIGAEGSWTLTTLACSKRLVISKLELADHNPFSSVIWKARLPVDYQEAQSQYYHTRVSLKQGNSFRVLSRLTYPTSTKCPMVSWYCLKVILAKTENGFVLN